MILVNYYNMGEKWYALFKEVKTALEFIIVRDFSGVFW